MNKLHPDLSEHALALMEYSPPGRGDLRNERAAAAMRRADEMRNNADAYDIAAAMLGECGLSFAAAEARQKAEAVRDYGRIRKAIAEGRAEWQRVDVAEALRARGWV
jgi:hypothetical protein